MRRLLPIAIVSVALLAACGDGAKVATSTPVNSGESTASSGAGLGSATVPTVPAECLNQPTTTTVAVPPLPEGKPTVQIPKTLPTKLVITDLITGVGPAAKSGDTVTVNYVGVRSADGTEFDNSYDKGQTFPVTLGAGSVIPGWDQGLIGIKAGGRRQLDIPAALAYGDNPQGEIIKPGDALTFIVDAISIAPGIPTVSAEDKPKVTLPKDAPVTEVKITDLVKGDKCNVARSGQTAALQITAYRADTGLELSSTWDSGAPASIPLTSQTIPGLVNSVVGMGVGGRRLVVIPPALGFGTGGSENLGLPANTNLVLVIDLVQLK